MSIKPLLDQLHQDALEERERRLTSARALIPRMHEDAEHLLQHERKSALAHQERALRAELDRDRAVVSRQCQLEELHARRRLADRCLSTAAMRTATLRQNTAFTPALMRQVQRALGYLPPGACRIRVAPALESELHPSGSIDVAPKAEVVVDGTIDFGFVLEALDGSVRVDATLGTLITRERDALAIEIVRRYQGQAP